MRALRLYAERKNLGIDWKAVGEAPNETLVDSLAILAPFGPREKQVLLEAIDLRARAEALVAMTEIDLAGDGASRGKFH